MAAIDERVEHMARAIYEAYRDIGEVNRQTWDEMAAEPLVFAGSLAKFRKAAEEALDTIEWVKFYLAPAETSWVPGGAYRPADAPALEAAKAAMVEG